jgi:hypothetical protein
MYLAYPHYNAFNLAFAFKSCVSSRPPSTLPEIERQRSWQTGRENDDTEVYYYRARCYSPVPRRFLRKCCAQHLRNSTKPLRGRCNLTLRAPGTGAQQ